MASAAFVNVAGVGLRGLAVGFGSAFCSRTTVATPRARPMITMVEARSESMPFLPKPANLDESMPGYTGFDPLGFTDAINVKWLQEGEIKNGRVAMLAFLGLLVQEFFHLPADAFSNPLGTEAFFQVPVGGLFQIFIFCGIVELITHRGDVSYVQYVANADKHDPGNFGFNPLNLKFDKRMREAEIKNGRLAMIGVGGMIHAMLLYKVPTIQMLTHFPTFPGL